MKNRYIQTLIIILFCSYFLQGQNLLEEYQKKYPSSDYVVLNRERNIRIDIEKNGELKIRCSNKEKRLFLNNKAVYYADDEVYYGSFWDLDKISVYTEIQKNKKSKKIYADDFINEKSISDDHFHDDVKNVKFYIPSMREGACVNIDYTLLTDVPFFLKIYSFQSLMPILRSRLTVNTDKNIKMGFLKFNFDSVHVDYQSFEKGKRRMHQFTTENIDGFSFENNMGGTQHYIPHIIPYVIRYTHKDSAVHVLSNVQDLYAWYRSLLQNSDSTLSEEKVAEVKKLVQGIESEKEQVKVIFRWVQSNIKYIAVEEGLGGFVPDDADNVYDKRYGDCKGKSELLRAMLGSVGINSYLTWIGTRDIPYGYNENFTPYADNHMIVTYIDPEGNYYFLDPTDSYIPFGMPTAFIQGKDALIGKGNDFEIRKVPVSECQESVFKEELCIETDDQFRIIGSGKAQFTGYFFSEILNDLTVYNTIEEKKEYFSQLLNCGNNKFLLNDYKLHIDVDNYQIETDYDFSIGDYIVVMNNELFINMNLLKSLINKKIKQTDILDKHYDKKFFVDFSVKLKIPKGWKVSYLPENKIYSNKYFMYSINYSITDDVLKYSITLSHDTIKLRKNDFELYNELTVNLNRIFKNTVKLTLIENE